MERIIGLVDAPFTPMKPNGDINLEPIPRYAAMLAKNGLVGVFINGSSGEGYMLTTDERKALAEAWMKAAPKGFKVIVHVGSCCLRESVELAKHASAIGAWGIGAMAPPFPKIGRVEELVKYCGELIFKQWPLIQERLKKQLYSPEEAIKMLKEAGAPTHYTEIGLPLDQFLHAPRAAQLIRKRYTCLDMLYEAGLLDAAIATIA